VDGPLECVLKCWEGLGYYSRARNLLKGARYVVANHSGELPAQKEALAKIPGIGPYTLGAILSFTFHQKAAAVDGNVLRVLNRFIGYEGYVDSFEGRKKLHAYAEAILPDYEPWIIVEALIELGALVCMKKAKCCDCPIQQECLAYRHQLQDLLPKKSKSIKTTRLIRHVAVIKCQGSYLIEKREGSALMKDLYEYPYFNTNSCAVLDPKSEFEKQLGLLLEYIKPLAKQKHSFTRYQADLLPHLFETKDRANKYSWRSLDELLALPLSSGHKRILISLME
jgi:A/G-specific adenine glycosylase